MKTCGSPHDGRANGRPHIEVADIFRAHGEEFRQRHALTPQQLQVMAAIETCRTAVLGGHADVCQSCGHVEVSYNSCRNRHCPKCQGLSSARWIAQRSQRILPTNYFHLVFTLPTELRPLAMRNRRQVFKLLFKAATSTLLELGHDAKWLGATLGISAVLHTWTRELLFHPHLHCIVTGGGLGNDDRWHSAKKDFLFPVRVLSALFRGKLLDGLCRLERNGELELAGPGDPGQQKADFYKMIEKLYCTDWVVYAKPPFGGPETVFAYLSRYTHRVAISNARLRKFDGQKVTFRTKNGDIATLNAQEFIRRFLLHVLPKGFVKIRHYGLLSPLHAKTTLERARDALQSEDDGSEDERQNPVPTESSSDCNFDGDNLVAIEWPALLQMLTGQDPTRCPCCGGPTVRVALHEISPQLPPEILDTS